MARTMAVVALAAGLLARTARAEPDFLWFHTYGLSNYASRWPGFGPDLNVQSMHSSFATAIDAIDPYTSAEICNCGYVDTALPGHMASSGTPAFCGADFGVVHAHGPALSWCGGTSWFNDGVSPFTLGSPDSARFVTGLDSVHWGGDGWSGFLRWVWAASCDWFNVGWAAEGIWPIGTSSPLVSDFGTAILLDTQYTARHWDRTDYGGYYASDLTVGPTQLTGCSTGNMYKRVQWFTPTGALAWDRFDSCNTIVLVASASGSSAQHQGNIIVCMGNSPREDPDVFDPNTSNPIATIRVFGSGGSATEYGGQLTQGGSPAFLTDFGVDILDLYLVFDSCAVDLTVHDVWFHYNPLYDATVLARMDTLVDTYGPVFDGIHCILGWSGPGTTVLNASRFGPFLENWVTDTTYYTSTAFLSLGTYPFYSHNIAPAAAFAVGSGADRYKYLMEKWYRAGNEEAPGSGCMIAWCVPYFDDPLNGVYWVEE